MAPAARSASPESAPQTPPRHRIGRYVIVDRLGRGGMGMVYRALDEALEREVALKTLTGEGTLDEESRRRFEIEAKAAARLQHPNIVTVYELGQERGIPFIAMELLPGGDLETLLRSGEALLLREKLDVAIQVCRGLAFAHEHKVVHRDVKPSNIRLLDDGSVKIMDFGIAKLGSTNVTRAGMMVGTMNYMSPEQIRGLPLDGRSDVFSLGVILYQMLAGRRPFAGKGTDVLYKIVQEETPALGVDLGAHGAHVEQVVRRSLAKDAAQRYASAADLARDLEALLARHAPPQAPTAADQQSLAAARTVLKSGRVEEALRKLEPLLASNADWLDARRLLRAARREQQRKLQPGQPQSTEFPELDATFKAPLTQRSTPTIAAPLPAPAPAIAKWLFPAAGALLVAAVAAGVLLLRPRTPASQPLPSADALPAASVAPVEPATGAQPAAALRPAAAPLLVALGVETDPAGASISLDGKKLGTTPGEIRIDPAKDHVVALAREGFKPQEVRIGAGRVPPSLRLALEAAGPPGSVSVVSSYAVEVFSKGKLLAKGVSPKVTLAAGTHSLTIVSAQHFLRREVGVEVKPGGSSGVEAPGVGQININANPDNCEVFIDGTFVDYPPIRNRDIAAGTHTVTFKWPDGAKKDERTEVSRGGIAYLTGKKGN